jgi:hypothetical protein
VLLLKVLNRDQPWVRPERASTPVALDLLMHLGVASARQFAIRSLNHPRALWKRAKRVLVPQR